MFGLSVAVILCLIVTPVLYAIVFHIHEPAPTLAETRIDDSSASYLAGERLPAEPRFAITIKRLLPMTMTEADPIKSRGLWLSKSFRFALAALRFVVLLLLLVWGTLAVYYSNLPWAWLRLTLSIAFGAFGVWSLWLGPVLDSRQRFRENASSPELSASAATTVGRAKRRRIAFAALFLLVLVWFISIQPSHDRPWRPEVAVMPRAIVDGDRVRLTGVRDFDFRTRDDFTVRHVEREVSLSHLTSVDLFLSYWRVGPVGHTFLSFNFDNAPPVCISIETRPEVGEGFQPVASMFKQLELIYVVGDERDMVRLRAKFRGEEIFLYRLQTSPEVARTLFLVYLDRINELADQPEFYHLLKNSCTINIVRYANVSGRVGRWDIRHILNGWVDRYLYRAGLVDTSMPFEELRQRSRITEIVQAADNDPDFSRRIRESLPGTH